MLQEARLTTRQMRDRVNIMGFAEYDTPWQAYMAIQHVNNYILDLTEKEDKTVLKLSFAKARNKNTSGAGGKSRRDSYGSSERAIDG